MPFTDHLRRMTARFDALALRPPLAAEGEALWPTTSATPWQSLLAWCQADAGPGGSAWWRPGALPTVARRLTVATLNGPADRSRACAQALGRTVDGSLRLEALPRLAGLAWRLQVKVHDAAWWRQRQPTDPWDAGWAVTAAECRQQLALRFMPRRATLVLADAADRDALSPVVDALAWRSGQFAHPVRWLWVDGPVAADAVAHESRFVLG